MLCFRIIVIAALAGIAGCQLFESDGQKRVKHFLKDPASAEFRNMQTYSNKEGVVYCGEVNSKNSYGAMGGFEKYVVKDRVVIIGDEGVIYDGDLSSAKPGDNSGIDPLMIGKLDLSIMRTETSTKNLQHKNKQYQEKYPDPVLGNTRLIDTAWEKLCR